MLTGKNVMDGNKHQEEWEESAAPASGFQLHQNNVLFCICIADAQQFSVWADAWLPRTFMNTCPRGHFHPPFWHLLKGRGILNPGMKGTVSGWKRLSNGGVTESKVWPSLFSSIGTVFPISTAKTKEHLWRMAINQKLSPMEKGIKRWREILYFGEEKKEITKWMAFSIFRKRSWEGSEIAASYWCHHPEQFELLDVLHWVTLEYVSPAEKWREELQTCNLPKPACFPQFSHFLLVLSVPAHWIQVSCGSRCCHWFLFLPEWSWTWKSAEKEKFLTLRRHSI